MEVSMFVYMITFLGGSKTEFRANSPKEAFDKAQNEYGMEVIHIKFLRGKSV